MKQTEVGLIPDDWEVKRLGETNHVATGSTPSTIDKSNYGNDYFFVSPLDLGEGKYILKTEKKLSKKGFSLCRSFPKGSILFTCIGSTIGKCGIANKELTSNQQINAIFPNDKIDNEFLYYILQNRTEDIRSRAGQQAVPLINKSEFEETLFPLPPLAEQKRIAKALSDVDALISTTEKLIQKKKNIKQGAMQNLLTGKIRLPAFGEKQADLFAPNGTHIKEVKGLSPESIPLSTKMKQSELGLIPEDWEVKKFNELFEICTETISVDSIKKESYIGTENMLQDKMGVIKYEAELNYLKVREYRKQDILVSNIRPYLKKIWFADKNGGCSTDVLVFRKRRNTDNANFLFKIVSDDRFFNIVNDNAVGTKMPRGDKNIIKQVLFTIPENKQEQIAIANVLSSMDKEIGSLQTKLEKYRNLKTAMMQQLLTGKIRL